MCRNKKETNSYVEIAESLGVDKPSEILFLTDVHQEAVAAKNAGICPLRHHLFNSSCAFALVCGARLPFESFECLRCLKVGLISLNSW